MPPVSPLASRRSPAWRSAWVVIRLVGAGSCAVRRAGCLGLFALSATGHAPAADPTSPEVHADRTVTFRLAGPLDGPVELVGRGPNQTDFPRGSHSLRGDASADREVTIGPLLPGVHFYKFRVGGRDFPDPENPRVQGFLNGPWSYFEVADPAPRAWSPRPGVPRGHVELRSYASAVLGHERPVSVYLPPADHGRPGSERLPVMYLLHGSHYNESSWVEFGRVPTIIDNLIADGLAPRMVVVMPFGYRDLPQHPGAEPSKWHAQWEEHLLVDLLPWVERTYRVAMDRDHRAIAGLSMGGAQALQLGLTRPDVFGAVGAFSPGRKASDHFPGAYAASLAPDAPRLRLLWLGCGRGDRYFGLTQTLSEKFAEAGVATTWHELEGRHTWRVWRECFSEFATLAFRSTSSLRDPSGR